MNANRLLILLPLLFVLFNSCREPLPSEGETLQLDGEEKNKFAVERSLFLYYQLLEEIQTIETIDLIRDFIRFYEKSRLDSVMMADTEPVLSMMKSVEYSFSGQISLSKMLQSLTLPLSESDPDFSIREFIDRNAGTFEWNRKIDNWDFTPGNHSVSFHFPSRVISDTNDVSLKLSNYQGIQTRQPWNESYSGDLPVSFSLSLKKEELHFIHLLFGANYTEEGLPSNMVLSINIEKYNLELTLTNNQTMLHMHHRMKDNGVVVVDFESNASGLFTMENYEENLGREGYSHKYVSGYIYSPDCHCWEPVIDTLRSQQESLYYENILETATVSCQLYDIAFRGDIKLSEITANIRNINSSGSQSDHPDLGLLELYLEEISLFTKLNVIDILNDTTIASIEPYIKKIISDESSHAALNFRIVFDDGSMIDADAYAPGGIDYFADEFNHFIQTLIYPGYKLYTIGFAD